MELRPWGYLDEKYRTVIVLYYVEGFKMSENRRNPGYSGGDCEDEDSDSQKEDGIGIFVCMYLSHSTCPDVCSPQTSGISERIRS